MGRKYPSDMAERRRVKRSDRQSVRDEVDEANAGVTRHQVAGYHVEVTPDDLDGGYTVQCVELPGCISEGDTIDEALANIADAISEMLST